jgi:ATP-binding protein involved in chromosome partitioning
VDDDGRRSLSPGAIPEPADIEVDREHGLTIEWDDGHVSRFGLEPLRLNCQCAECRGLRQRDVVVWPSAGAPETLRIESAELVGSYGMSIVWNDTHSTGIYSWETLLAWCACPRCTSGE